MVMIYYHVEVLSLFQNPSILISFPPSLPEILTPNHQLRNELWNIQSMLLTEVTVTASFCNIGVKGFNNVEGE